MAKKGKTIYIIFFLLVLAFLIYILAFSRNQLGGDIVEYYGITESVLNHGSLELTPHDTTNLIQTLNKGYLDDIQYYMVGIDGKRHTVHFVAYSLFVVPIRFILHLFNYPREIKALAVTNLLFFSAAIFAYLHWFAKNKFEQIAILILTFLSPMAYFVIWPSPEVYSTSLILISLLLFYKKKYLEATLVSALAGWQAQPLILLSGVYYLFYLIEHIFIRKKFTINLVVISVITGLFLILPNIYSLVTFGRLDPWFQLREIQPWIMTFGFGLQNASLKKLYELFFDLNIGVFWYMPVIFITGSILFFALMKKNWRYIALIITIIAIGFTYQTNPNWNNGTAGYGPTRYALYIVPFCIYAIMRFVKKSPLWILIFIGIITTQWYVFSFNGYIDPIFDRTLYHTPYATFVLDHFPSFYNPTQEIFYERTIHGEPARWNIAIYRDSSGTCKKALTSKASKGWLIPECKYIPPKYDLVLEDEFKRKANYPRTLTTTDVVFWPDIGACAENFIPNPITPYICMRTIQDVVKFTGVTDLKRIEQFGETPGLWKITYGSSLDITMPAGYIVERYEREGIYVDYP